MLLFEIGKTFLLAYRVTGGLPTSKYSHDGQSLQGSLNTSVTVLVNPDRLMTGFEMSAALAVGRNFHEMETAYDGSVNTQYSSSQSLSLSYSFESGISLSTDFLHRNAWSYQNSMKDGFEMSQELGYQINSTWAAAIGHTNSGSSLKPNGTDSNVQLINENEFDGLRTGCNDLLMETNPARVRLSPSPRIFFKTSI